MRKKLILLTASLATTVVLISACGTTANQGSSTSSTNAPSTSKSAPASSASAGQTVEIKLMAKDFEYDQKEIHVKKGDKVKITLQSDDGGHGFTIPAYKVEINGNGSAEFTADKAGKFEYHCSVFCGSGHTKMTGTLIVV